MGGVQDRHLLARRELNRRGPAGGGGGPTLLPEAERTISTRDGSLSALDMIPACAILFREFFIPGLREFLGNINVVLKVSWLAKWKTTMQLVALAVVLVEPAIPGMGIPSDILLWIAGVLTIWTGWEYLRSSWQHLVEEQK